MGNDAIQATGLRAGTDVTSHLRQASQRTGISFDFLLATAKRESSLNPQANSGSSTAAGLFQFVEQTWFGAIKNHGAQFGLAAEAQKIQRSDSGKLQVEDATQRDAILKLRFDPEKSAQLAAALAEENREGLSSRLGRPVTDGELYIAHFLGVGGAAKLLSADKTAIAAPSFPAAARANPTIFFADGVARTTTEVVAQLQQGFDISTRPAQPALPKRPANGPALQVATGTVIANLRPEKPVKFNPEANEIEARQASRANPSTIVGQQISSAPFATNPLPRQLPSSLTPLFLLIDPSLILRDRKDRQR